MKQLPTLCPSCGGLLRIRSLDCAACGTSVAGEYDLPALMQLPAAEQEFVLEFLLCSGSLKEMARKMGLSYPTVRNRLDEIIGHIQSCLDHETAR